MFEKAVEEMQADIEDDQDKDSVIGIKAFHSKLVSNLMKQCSFIKASLQQYATSRFFSLFPNA